MNLKPLVPILLSTMLLTGCGNKYAAKVGNREIYKTNIEKISHSDTGDWILSGTTEAPDDSKILVTTYDKESMDYGSNGSESTKSPASFAIIQDGKFKVPVDPIELTDSNDQKAGKKTKLLIFAVANYNKKWESAIIPKNIVNKARESQKPETVSISKSQEKYIKDLDKDRSSSKSKNKNNSTEDNSSVKHNSDNDSKDSNEYNASEGENNAQTLNYGQLVKSDNFIGKSYHISKAEVLQAEETSGKTLLLAYIDDDPDHLFMILYNGKTQAAEDDYIEVEGILGKREDYKTNIGGSNTVPSMVAKNIVVTGHEED